ncbi:MAG TPA: CARDB domain-containing protein [Phycisphaerae bacterium]|nr:CARDB domain-containing protein [Phycisphaerae bacterium]
MPRTPTLRRRFRSLLAALFQSNRFDRRNAPRARWERIPTAFKTATPFLIDNLEPRLLLAGDLQLVSASILSPAKAGTPVTVTWTVKNVGDAPVSGSWYDSVFISDDNQLDSTFYTPPGGGASSLPVAAGAPVVAHTSIVNGMAVVAGGLHPASSPVGSSSHIVPNDQTQSDQRIDSFDESAHADLAPGASYTETRTIVLPARFGDQYLIFRANDFNFYGITESDPANNILAIPVTVTQPDINLQVSNVVVPSGTLTEGSQITLQWTDTNTGADTAAALWQDVVYLSSDQTLDASDVSIGGLNSPTTLGPGESSLRSFTTTLPSFPTGDQYVIVVANPNQQQFETDYTDNTASAPISLTAPDLAISNLSAPPSAVAGNGQTINVSWTDTNLSDIPTSSRYSDYVYISDTPDMSGDNNDFLGFINVNSLAAHASVNQSTTVTIPNYPAGQWYIVVVTNAFQGQPEADTTNNTASSAIQLSAPNIDLAISNPVINTPAPTSAGDPVSISYTVTNNGTDATGSNQYYDQLFLSTTPGFTPGSLVGTINGATFRQTLAGGASRTDTITGTLPSIPAPGDYYLVVVMDAGIIQTPVNSQADSDFSNNVISIPIHLEVPDIAVTDSSADTTAAAGGPINVSWTITNQGTGEAVGTWYDNVYLSTSPTPDLNSAIPLGSIAGSPLAPGASYTRNETFTLPGLAPGNYYVYIDSDLYDELPENNLANNVSAANPVTITAPQVDLTVSIDSAPTTIVAGDTGSISYTVTNLGTADTTRSVYVEAFLSPVDYYDPNTAIYLTGNIANGLAAGKSVSYTSNFNFNLPPNFDPNQTYYLVVNVDNGNQIPESDETNNEAASPITITARDVGLSDLVAPSQAVTGSSFNLQYTVTIGGTAPLDQQSTDEIYLATDPQGQNIVQYLGFVDDPFNVGGPDLPLPVGTTYTANAQATLYSGIADGDYYLIVQAVPNFPDSDPTNNMVVQSFHVGGADLTVSGLSVTGDNPALGQPVTVTWTTQNIGSSDAVSPWFDDIYVSQNPTLDYTAVRVGQVAADAPLASGDSYTHSTDITLPNVNGWDTGDYYVFVVADNYNQIVETDEGNNVASATIDATRPDEPNLTVSNVTLQSTAVPGGLISVQWTLNNTGPADATGPWTDNVALFTNPDGTGYLTQQEFSFNGTIAAGDSVTRSQLLRLPPNYTGPVYATVTANVYGDLVEEPGGLSDNTATSAAPADVEPAPLPDLVVTNVSAPQNVVGGDQFQVSFTVANQGGAPTSASLWRDYVILSQDPNLTYPDGALGDQIINNQPVRPFEIDSQTALNPGDSYTQTLTVQLPIDAQGTWYLYVFPNGIGGHFPPPTLSEVSRDNNMTPGDPINVTLRPPPDLDVTSVVTTPDAFSGQPTNVSWTVANIGAGPTVATEWQDYVYLSADGQIDANSIYLGNFFHEGALASGASYTQNQQVALPVGISGDYSILVQTDAAANVFEDGFTDNNISSGPVTVHLTPPPDLVASNVSAPLNAQASHPITVSWTVTNAGATATPNGIWTDTVYLSPTAAFDSNTAIKVADINHVGALGTGASYTVNTALTIPDGVSGSYYVIVVSDNTDLVFELDNANNAAAAPTPTNVVSLPADLVVSASAPPTVQTNHPLPVTWTVTNQGTGDTAVSDWIDKVYLTTDGTLNPDTAMLLGAVAHHGLLNAGDSYTVSQNFVFPANLSGPYNLFVVTDAAQPAPDIFSPPLPNGTVYEGANENNNTSAAVAVNIVQQLADLQVSTVSVAAANGGSIATGQNLTVSWTVQNNGADATNSAVWNDDVYLSTTPTLTGAVGLGTVTHTGALAAGASYQASTTLALPATLAAGTYYILVITDRPGASNAVLGINLVLESNEDNNLTASTPFNVALSPAPDLVTTVTSSPSAASVGSTLSLSWTDTNNGPAAAVPPVNGWVDVVYLSADNVFDPGIDKPLGFTLVNTTLNPGDSTPVSANVQLPAGITGDYYLFVVSNVTGALYERGPGSNVSTGQPIAISLQPAVNLFFANPPTDISAPATATPGQPMTVTYTVSNDTANSTAADWDDAVYLSTTSQWTPEAALLGTVHHTGGLDANSSYTASLTAAVPALGPGNYYVIVRADVRNIVPDFVPADNTAAATTPTFIDAPALALDTPADGAVTVGGAQYYKVSVAAGQTLKLTLTGPAADSLDLVGKFGIVPNRSDFDFRGVPLLAASQTLTIPATQAGDYYFLVYGDAAASGSIAYTLTAAVVPFAITGVERSTFSNAGPSTLKITGSQFSRDTTFELLGPGNTVLNATAVTVADASTAYATFNLTGQTAGNYTLRALQPDTSHTDLATPITVSPGIGGHVEVSLQAPALALAGRDTSFTISVRNTGDADIAAPLLVIDSATGTPFSVLLGGPQTDVEKLLLAISPDGPAGIIRPGETVTAQVYVTGGVGGTNAQFNVASIDQSNTQPLDWDHVTHYLLSDITGDPLYSQILTGLHQMLGSTGGSYDQALAAAASLLPADLGRNWDAQDLVNFMAHEVRAALTTSLAGTLHASDPAIDIADHTIYADNLTTGDSFSTFTQQNGAFFFDGLTPGAYTLAVDGLIGELDNVAVADGAHASGATVEVSRGAALTGAVTGNSAAVANATLELLDADDGLEYSAYTDANGNYQIAGIAPGTYTLTVYADGFARSQTSNLLISAQDLQQNVALSAGDTLTGAVSLQDGGPAGPVSVTATALDGDLAGQVFSTTTLNGAFSLAGLADGNYAITLSADGYLPTTLDQFPVSGDTDTGDLSLLLPAVITGTLSSSLPDFDPTRVLIIASINGQTVAATNAAADGSFSFANLAPGDYTLSTESGRGLDVSAFLTLAPGQSAAQDLTIDAGGTLSGLVSSNGIPVAGVAVYLHDSAGNSQYAVTGSDGSYSFSGLDFGTYKVSLADLSLGSASATIIRTDGTVVTANLALTQTLDTSISGTLANADGSTVDGGIVQLVQNGQVVATSFADDTGHYGFLLLSGGTYDLRAASTNGDYAPLTNLTINSGQALTEDFTSGGDTLTLNLTENGAFAPGAQVNLFVSGDATPFASAIADANGLITFNNLLDGSYFLTAESADAGAAASIVLSAAQTSLPLDLNAQAALTGHLSNGDILGQNFLTLVQSGGGLTYVTSAGPDGAFTFIGVHPGAYDLVAIVNGFQTAVLTHIVLTAGNTATQDVAVAPSAATLTGHLTDDHGNPLAGARVTITDAAGHTLATATTNASGSFTILEAAGAGLTLTASIDGHAPRAIDLPTLAGAVDVGTLALSAAAISQTNAGSVQPASITPGAAATVTGPVAAPATGSTNQSGIQGIISQLIDAINSAQQTVSQIPLPADQQAFVQTALELAKQILALSRNSAPIDPPSCPECMAAYQKAVQARKQRDDYLNNILIPAAERVVGQTVSTLTTITLETASLAGSIAGVILAAIGAAEVALGSAVVAAPAASTGAFAWFAATFKNDLPAITGIVGDISAYYSAMASAKQTGDFNTNAVQASGAAVDFAVIITNMARYAPALGLGAGASLLASLAPFYNHDWFERSKSEMKITDTFYKNLQKQMKEYQKLSDKAQNALQAYLRCESDSQNTCNPNPPPPPIIPPILPIILPIVFPWIFPHDPNQIAGPGGFGAGNEVSTQQPLNYRVDFQNQPGSAPAQTVTVSAAIHPALDPRTVRLGTFGWGGLQFTPPANSSYYHTRVDLLAADGFDVDVTAFVDVQAGTVNWIFQTVDPATGTTPTDPAKGFLPADDGAGIGDGFATYTVDAPANATQGESVAAQARVIFDTQPPIDTNVFTNTLEAAGASSSITSANRVGNTDDIDLAWSGTDAPNDSGIAGYNIYVSDNAGAYTVLESDTTDTSALFHGQANHTYQFYSVAVTNAGTIEPPPAAADFAITLGTPDTPPSVTVGDDTTLHEGDTLNRFGSFTDPDAGQTFSATVNFGDGSGDQVLALNPDNTFSLAHRYDDNGSYTVTVTVSDNAGGVTPASFNVSVLDTAPIATVSNSGPVPLGGPGAVTLFNIYDPSNADTTAGFTFSFDFGNTGAFQIANSPSATALIPANFLVAPGTLTVRARVADKDGLYTDYLTTVTIVDSPPRVSLPGKQAATTSAPYGESGSFTDAPSKTWTATVDYGDGTGVHTLALNADNTFDLSHQYAAPGTYTITVRVTDNFGLTGVATEDVVVSTPPPAAEQITTLINNGAAQRSMVTSITYIFSSPVTLDAGAFTLTRSDGTQENVIATLQNGGTQVVLTFTGSDIVAGSLADGSYTLTMHGDKVHTAGGTLSDSTLSFFRIFGDLDGNGAVDASDYAAMRAANGSSVGSANYVAALDYDGNGTIDSTDTTAFRQRYGHHI